MPKAKKSKEINLLPVDKFAESYIGKTLTWLLTTFRFLVIIVEIIVMGAFLSRFWLDAKNSDLNDEIKQKQAVIAASKDFEDEYNNLKQKLVVYTAATKGQEEINSYLQKIPTYTPSTISLTNITTSPSLITLSGNAPSEQFVAQLIANLSQDSGFDNVSLSSIQTDEDTGNLKFKVSISLNTK